MTEHDPESVPDESSEADFVDQRADVDDDAESPPETDGFADDSWDADIADRSDQRIPAPLAEDDV